MARDQSELGPEGFTAETLALAADLKNGKRLLDATPAGCATVEARLGRNSLWLVIRTGGAALALRTAHGATSLHADLAPAHGGLCGFTAVSPEATFRVSVEQAGERLLRVRTWIKPTKPLLVPFWPRDLYPLGAGDDPTRARGEVIAAQRGFNAAVLFLRMDREDTAALYFQNLTALVPWFAATGTRAPAR